MENIKNYKARLTWIYLIVIAFFVNGYMPFLKIETGYLAITVFRATVVIATLWCLVMVLFGGWEINLRQGKPSLAAFAFILLIFGIEIYYSRANLLLPGGYDEIILTVQILMLAFCVPVLIGRDEQMFLQSVHAYRNVGIVIAIIAYFETIFGWASESCRYGSMVYFPGYSYHPPTSVFGNENNLAAFLLVVSAIIIMDIMSSQTFKGELYGMIGLAVVLVPAAIIDSTIFRIGIVIMVAVSIVVVFTISRQYGRNTAKSIEIVAVPYVVCFLLKKEIRKLFIYLNVKLSGGYITFGPEMDKLISGDSLSSQLQNSGMGTVTIRKNLFINALDAMKESPLLGYGPNGFANVFKVHPEYTAQTGGIINPHNFIAECMVNFGLPVAIALILLCVMIIVMPLKASKNHAAGAFRPVVIACFVLAIAFALSTVMPSSFMQGVIYFVPLFILASGGSILCKEKEEYEEKLMRRESHARH